MPNYLEWRDDAAKKIVDKLKVCVRNYHAITDESLKDEANALAESAVSKRHGRKLADSREEELLRMAEQAIDRAGLARGDLRPWIGTRERDEWIEAREDEGEGEYEYGDLTRREIRAAVQDLEGYIAEAEREFKALVDGKRNKSHGAFEDNSEYLDGFMDVAESSVLWTSLSATERVAIIMILSKISRYLSAPNIDHMRDVGGYSILGKREAERLGHPDSGYNG